MFLIFAPSASEEGFGRQLDLIQAPYLFSRVDAMPMRLREMRG